MRVLFLRNFAYAKFRENKIIGSGEIAFLFISLHIFLLGRLAQSVTCLATDACLTADPVVASLIPTWSHFFVGIDHEIISKVILQPSAESFKMGCCQLQGKVCAQSTG